MGNSNPNELTVSIADALVPNGVVLEEGLKEQFASHQIDMISPEKLWFDMEKQ